MKHLEKIIFQFHKPTYLWLERVRRKVRRSYETEKQKHVRERQTADYLLISPTNCGRTWLRIMLGRAMQLAHNVEDVNLHYLFSFSERNPNLPSIKAIHEKYGQFGSYERQKVILLVRDPRDALVSRYHQHKKLYETYADINAFILNSPELAVYVNDYNNWYQHRHIPSDFMTIRYEDMKANTYGELEKVLTFLGVTIPPQVIQSAIEFGSFKNMRSIEINGSDRVRAGVLKTMVNQPQTHQLKTRKGIVGGYKQELSAAAIKHMDAFIQENLHPTYGYGAATHPVHV
ncbi:MAG: sulfotransferase domain-containing protein [Cyanobacteria bacterium P01_D01_bin.156]